VRDLEEAKEFTQKHGFAIIFKAAFGGGGRGMRKVTQAQVPLSAFSNFSSTLKHVCS
jgi:pyruvate carboxylase